MLELLAFAAIAGGSALVGYVKSRRFVRERLWAVDAVTKNPFAPIIAGVAAALIAAPIMWLLPAVGAGASIVFGVAVGAGVNAGRRDSRALPGV